MLSQLHEHPSLSLQGALPLASQERLWTPLSLHICFGSQISWVTPCRAAREGERRRECQVSGGMEIPDTQRRPQPLTHTHKHHTHLETKQDTHRDRLDAHPKTHTHTHTQTNANTLQDKHRYTQETCTEPWRGVASLWGLWTPSIPAEAPTPASTSVPTLGSRASR